MAEPTHSFKTVTSIPHEHPSDSNPEIDEEERYPLVFRLCGNMALILREWFTSGDDRKLYTLVHQIKMFLLEDKEDEELRFYPRVLEIAEIMMLNGILDVAPELAVCNVEQPQPPSFWTSTKDTRVVYMIFGRLNCSGCSAFVLSLTICKIYLSCTVLAG